MGKNMKPHHKTVYIAHCIGCGVHFSQTTSVLRRVTCELAGPLACAKRCGAPAVVRSYRLVERA